MIIVHAEDDQDQITVLKALYKMNMPESTVFFAKTVNEALELIVQQHPDAIVTDYDLKGRQTGDDLAEQTKGYGIPIIGYNGNHDKFVKSHLFYDLIEKPESERLFRRLKEL